MCGVTLLPPFKLYALEAGSNQSRLAHHGTKCGFSLNIGIEFFDIMMITRSDQNEIPAGSSIIQTNSNHEEAG